MAEQEFYVSEGLGVISGGVIRYNTSTSRWELSTDGTNFSEIASGNYLANVTGGTGVTVTHTPGKASTASVAIGQAVGTSASVTFAQVTTTGPVVVGGDLTVNGTTTTVNTETINLADNTITLNSNETSAPTQNAGLEIERGTSNNVQLRWNETTDKWEITEDGSLYNEIATVSYVDGQSINTLDEIGDVTITSASAGDFLKWNGSAWVNDPVNLGNDTVGDYVQSLVAGTGVTLTNNSGESATPTVSIGQAVGPTSSVSFAAVTAPLVGNASTATTLQTARTISLGGDLSGSVSFNGGSNVTLTATVQPNSIALGTDTTGNFVADVVAGSGIAVTHTPGEASSASVALNAELNDLSDVAISPTSLEAGKVLGYTGTQWAPQDNGLDNLSDVSAPPTSLEAGKVLGYTGTQWAPQDNFLDSLSDVAVPSPTNGQVLTYSSASNTWIASTVGSSATTTTVSTAAATEIYSYNSSTLNTVELTIQVSQGTKRTSQKALVNHDASSIALIANYAVLEHGTPRIPLTVGANYTFAGVTWTTRTSNFSGVINSVALGNNLWVAGGSSGQIRTSTDTITWVTRTSNLPNDFTGAITSVANGNNLWVAAGLYGNLRTSTDAITWTTRTSNFGTTAIRSVAFGNNLWVAVGDGGQIRTSTDAITWVTRTSNFGTTGISSVAFGNNIWVAAGSNGQLRTSTDAITWVTRTSNFANDFTGTIFSVAFGNNLWVAGGWDGNMRTSTDAITWVTRTSNFGTTRILSVAFGNNIWVAAGQAGELRTSTDAITWVTRTSNFDFTNITTAANGNNLWVAAGASGQLRSSAASTSVTATITDAATTNATVKVVPTLLEA